MKTTISMIFTLVTCFYIMACNENEQSQVPKTPLESGKTENKVAEALGYVPKQRQSDVLQSLYQSIADTTADLKAIEQLYKTVYNSKTDSLRTFNGFTSKNEMYFNEAGGLINSMKDEELKSRMLDALSKRRRLYDAQFAADSALFKLIDSTSINIEDLRNSIKILVTLPVMEEFQQKGHPSNVPMQGYLIEQQKLVEKLKSTTPAKAN